MWQKYDITTWRLQYGYRRTNPYHGEQIKIVTDIIFQFVHKK
jgi:hypothetical protein